MKLRDFLNTIDVNADKCEFEVKCPNGAQMKYKQAWAIPQDMQNRNICGKVDFTACTDNWGNDAVLVIYIVLK